MDIQNRKLLKTTAKERLASADSAVRIALCYAAVLAGATLINQLAQMFLGSRMSQAGGLSNLGMRSILSTLQTMLPIVINFLVMCLALGFTGAMLRISRKQYASLNSLRIGFDRFWVLLRATLLQGGLYVLSALAAYILSVQIFFLTPMSKDLFTTLMPMVKGTPEQLMAALQSPEIMEQVLKAMVPMYLITFVLFLILAAPIYYRYVLTHFLLIDRPGTGALMALQESRMLMRGHCIQFLKLDISLWPYYAASALSFLISFLPGILNLMGIPLPLSPTAFSMICFGVSLTITFLASLFLQPHLEITHALAYDSLLPKVQSTDGAVLGNIFDLAKEQMDQMDS